MGHLFHVQSNVHKPPDHEETARLAHCRQGVSGLRFGILNPLHGQCGAIPEGPQNLFALHSSSPTGDGWTALPNPL